MAPPNRGQEVLFSQHEKDVPLGVSAEHIGTPYNGVNLSKSLSGVSLGKLGVNEAYPVSHGRDMLGLQPELVKAGYSTGRLPS